MPQDKTIAVELSTPLTDMEFAELINTVKELKEHGVKLLTLPDNPLGKSHIDSSMLAAFIKTEFDLDVITHINARDRNLLAIEALLLGLSSFELDKVLLIKGDNVNSQYKFNEDLTTLDLISHVNTLEDTEKFSRSFNIFSALNTSSKSFKDELKYADKKIAAGTKSFMTQILFSDEQFENLKHAREYFKPEYKLLAGIFPLLNKEHALHLNQNAKGIDIPENIISNFDSMSPVDLAIGQVERVLAIADGIYLVIPKHGLGLTLDILKNI